MQKRCGLQVKATESLFPVNVPVLNPLDRTAIKKKIKHYGAGLNSPPHPKRRGEGWKGGNWRQVKGYCHFKKPAD